MKKILLTGGFGFLGQAIHNNLSAEYQIFRFRSSEFDLRDENQTKQLFNKIKPDIVINAAARLGGIGDNQNFPANYFRDNMLIGLNVLTQSVQQEVSRIIQIGTVCSYPKIIPTPFREKDLWNGYPEGTNSAYGVSKRALISYSEALMKQYDININTVLLANLYGPGDDFRDETSHVIPAIIKKMDGAIENGDNSVVLWGDGSPTRDFLYIEDAAKGIISLLDSEVKGDVFNIATGTESSIQQVVKEIADLIGYKGSIIYDTSKPNGQPRRLLDTSKIHSETKWKAKIDLRTGISNTIKYYRDNKKHISRLTRKYL